MDEPREGFKERERPKFKEYDSDSWLYLKPGSVKRGVEGRKVSPALRLKPGKISE